jgi:hypothetical protein
MSEDWVLHDEGGFSIRLPPKFHRVEVQGIDSHVGQYETEDRSLVLSYVFGQWSSNLVHERDSFREFQPSHEVISGENALVVNGILKDGVSWIGDGRYVVAATWQRGAGVSTFSKLTITIQMVDDHDRSAMLEVLRTVSLLQR